MRKIYIALFLFFVLITSSEARIGFGLQGGMSSYSGDILPGSSLKHSPYALLDYYMDINSSLGMQVYFQYGKDNFDYQYHSPSGEVVGGFPVEDIAFRDMGIGASVRYYYFKPDYKKFSSYVGGGFSVHFFNTESNDPTDMTEYLKDKSVSGLFALLGINYRPYFSPVKLVIEGSYHTFKLSGNTVGVTKLQLGVMYQL